MTEETLKKSIDEAYKQASQDLELEQARNPNQFLIRYGAGHGHNQVIADMRKILLRNLESKDIGNAILTLVEEIKRILEGSKFKLCWPGVNEAGVGNMLQIFVSKLSAEFQKQSITLPEIDFERSAVTSMEVGK